MASPTAPRRPTPTSESSRARRFALPELADDRTDEFIEAFLAGRGRSSAVAAWQPEPQAQQARLPGRLAWAEALQRESQRFARYGSPAAVAVLELRALRPTPTLDSWLRLHATPVAAVLARSTRATDTVARVTSTRFQVLLPETSEDGAGEFVARVVGECHDRLREAGAPLTLKAGVAAASHELPLAEAVSRAVASLEAA